MSDDASISRFRDAHAAARSRLSAAKKRRQETTAAAETAVKARELVRAAAVAAQSRAHQVIAGLVTRCLHAVFVHEPYDFRIEFVQRRNKTEADLFFERGGRRHEYTQVGGGVLDVAAFGLRLAALVLRRPAVRKVMVLDEPFRFLSERGGNLDRMRELLTTLADETGFQFVIVSHSGKLEAGHVVRL